MSTHDARIEMDRMMAWSIMDIKRVDISGLYLPYLNKYYFMVESEMKNSK